MSKPRFATVWLDGCSGCHMSLLDMDERLIDLAQRVDLVCSPLVDAKEFPEDVDVTLVEGAVSSEEDLHRIRTGPLAHEAADLAGRLRGHRQCAGHAQPVRRGSRAAPRLTWKTYTLDAQIPREVIPALLPDDAPGARSGAGGFLRSGLPAVRPT